MELEAAILAARDQPNIGFVAPFGPRREQCFFQRIDVSCFRIIDELDAIDFRDSLEPVRAGVVGFKRVDHGLERQA